MSANYILTGRPGSGKSALAAWLCSRLAQPVGGLRTVCIGRSAAGPLFGVQERLTGRVEPLPPGAEAQTPAFGDFLAEALTRAAVSCPTVLVDEADCLLQRRPAALDALLDGPAAAVVVVGKADRTRLNVRPDDGLIDLDDTTPEAVRAALARDLPARLHPGVTLRLFRQEKCFGPGPMELLELVGRTGSLHKAAAAMGMAYSKAWKLLGALEQQWGFAMLQRSPGGPGGGGSLLTPAAWDLLARYRRLQCCTELAAGQAFARCFADFDPAPGRADAAENGQTV